MVKLFLAETHVPYRILLGDDATAPRYGIHIQPDTFLIDRRGRVAAAYRAGLVDKGDFVSKLLPLVIIGYLRHSGSLRRMPVTYWTYGSAVQP